MKAAHILRKYNPSEWGGTETAVQRLLEGLRQQGVESVVMAPKLAGAAAVEDPFRAAGHEVRRVRSFLPVLGISREQKAQLLAVGGNLMSFELVRALRREPELDVIHTHALNRFGGIARKVAQERGLPLVVTIHGGVLDLPAAVRENLARPMKGGFEWGRIFGVWLRSRQLLGEADAILTCNRREAELLEERYPRQKIVVQPHAVPVLRYQEEHRPEAEEAFPAVRGRKVLLVLGRIDPVKNQLWVVEQLREIRKREAKVLLVLAGSVTDEGYGRRIKERVKELGLENGLLMTGGLPPGDPRLIGLLQVAEAVIVPSHSETFGLVIIEAWAAGRAVISTATSGARDLISEGRNGWLFDLEQPASFHQAVDEVLRNPEAAQAAAMAGRKLAMKKFDSTVLAGQVANLYRELREGKRKD